MFGGESLIRLGLGDHQEVEAVLDLGGDLTQCFVEIPDQAGLGGDP